jgi:hypothetical protein
MLATSATPAEDAGDYSGLDMAESSRGESKDADFVLYLRLLVYALGIRVAEL